VADENHHPLSEPAQWVGGYSHRWSSDARALRSPFDFAQGGELCRTSGGFHFEAEGREGEGKPFGIANGRSQIANPKSSEI